MLIPNNIVGDWEVIHFTSLLLPVGEDGWIHFQVKEEFLKFNIKFVETENKDKTEIELFGNEGYGVFVLKNFNSSLGSATKSYLSIATLNDSTELSCLFAHYRISELHKIDFQFMIKKVG